MNTGHDDKRSPDFLTVDMNDPEDVQRLLGRVSNEARQAWINAARSAERAQLSPGAVLDHGPAAARGTINGGSEQGLRQSRDADKAKGTPALAAENEGATSAIASPSSELALQWVAVDSSGRTERMTNHERRFVDTNEGFIFDAGTQERAELIVSAMNKAPNSATSPIKVGEKPLMMAKAFMGLKPVTATIEDAQDMARELIRIADRADATK